MGSTVLVPPRIDNDFWMMLVETGLGEVYPSLFA